jgi:hypothetical protein
VVSNGSTHTKEIEMTEEICIFPGCPHRDGGDHDHGTPEVGDTVIVINGESTFHGGRGEVVSVFADGTTAFIRFENAGPVLPFGFGEILR